MTAASVAAGISGYQNTKYYNKNGDAIIGALVPDDALPALSDELEVCDLKSDEKRSIRLCHAAYNGIEASLPEGQKLTLFLAGSENIPARPSPITPELISYIQIQCDAQINLTTSRFAPTGRAGVIQAIHYAFEYIEQTNEEYLLIGGVDTYCNNGLLSRLDVEDRLLATGAADAFALGEGAGFVLFSRKPVRRQLNNYFNDNYCSFLIQ